MAPFRRDLASLALAALLAACTPERTAAPPPSPSPSTAAPSPTRTAAPVRPALIGVFGDWGLRGGRAHDVVALLGRLGGARPLDAVVTTGDNAYGAGRPHEAAFARELVEPLLRRGIPLYASLGNHDVATDGGRHVIRELGIPARWYTRVVGQAEIVVLDSTRPADPAQLAFVRRVMGAPRPVAFRVVVFHHPPTSCSLHGADRTIERMWVPLFRGTVDLALMGHNHTYERFDVGGTPYVTTGGGGARLYPSIPGLCKGPGRALRIHTVFHAVRLTVTEERLTVEAVGLDGETFDRYEVEPA